MVRRSTIVFEPAITMPRPLNVADARNVLPARAPRSVSPSFTMYSEETTVTPGFSVITRASASTGSER